MRVLLILLLSVAPTLAKGGFFRPAVRYVPAPKSAPAPAAQPTEPPPYVPPVYVTTTNSAAKPTNKVRYVRVEHVKTDSTNKPPVEPISISVTVDPPDPILQSQRDQAAKGFPEAQYAMGVRYLTGYGVERDDAQGKALLKAAADQGSTRARQKLRELDQ